MVLHIPFTLTVKTGSTDDNAERLVGDGHSEEDDAAYARRLQNEADREHYARLIDGHGTLEAALQGGVHPAQDLWSSYCLPVMHIGAASSPVLQLQKHPDACFGAY